MEAIDAILTRRSVRQFNDQEVDDDIINTILEAGMNAPSAMNTQPWHFIVVRDKNLLNQIADKIKNAHPCSEATVAIIACGDLDIEYKNNWPHDVSAATQNILLATRALGLGAVWCGIHPNEEKIAHIKELFALPDNIIPLCVIPIGYGDKEQKKLHRFQPDRVHFDHW